MKENKNRVLLMISIFVFLIVFKNAISSAYCYDFIENAQDWYNGGAANIVQLDGGLMSSLSKLVETIGTGVIAVVTVILGIKYVTGGVTGKADVKQQLIGLVVACVMLFGWSSLSPLLIKNATFNETTGTYETTAGVTQLFLFSGVSTPEQMIGKVFQIVLLFGKVISIVVALIIGVKYIYGGANEKSSIKTKAPLYLIGLLMIYCTLNFLTFISDAINLAL